LRHLEVKISNPASGCPLRMYSRGVERHFRLEKLSARYTDTVISDWFRLLKKRERMTSSGDVL
jgi:hypothetical protein